MNGKSKSDLVFYKLMSDGSVHPVETVIPLANKIGFGKILNLGEKIDRRMNNWFSDHTSSTLLDDSESEDEDRSFRKAISEMGALKRHWIGNTRVNGPVVLKTMDGEQSLTVKPILSGTDIKKNVSSGLGEIPRLLAHDTGRLIFWASHSRLLTWRETVTWKEGRDEVRAELPDGSVVSMEVDMSYQEEILPWEMEDYDQFIMSPNKSIADICRSLGATYAQSETRSNDTEQQPQVAGASPRPSRQKYLVKCIVISRHYSYIKPRDYEALNLMIITWSRAEANVASRVGVASIAERDWIKVKREWKMVILE